MASDPLRLTAVDRGPNLYELVSEQLIEAIRSAGLAPGSKIPSERELGERFGVSRTVIREAVRHLAAKGILEARTGSGIVVADIGHANVSESIELFLASRGPIDATKVYEVRQALELQTVALAASRGTDEQLAVIRGFCDELHELKDDPEGASRADVAFHQAIAAATGNELFLVLLESVGDLLLNIRRATLRDPGRASVTYDQHDRIAKALEARDVEGAIEAMRDHLDDSYHALRVAVEAAE